ncbi:hypothetical protein E0F88_31715 [Dyadobacter psychrotolerans]|uniref:DUF5723 domain-containing protein n=1 Tax=Dyadobacter psychrotolerans TaxID=2541721 RepID=A0A4R5DE52_9BACT|nr:hypothetical protein E0F88_31715 [Dyadobacter psychrotolerans]
MYRATYNPSVVGGSKQKWQINIGTIGASINHRYFVFLGKNSLLYPLLAPHSTKELYGRSRTMGSLTEDPIHLVSEIRWPSAMISIDKHQGIAIQFRTRGYVKGLNIPEPVKNLYFRRLDTDNTPPIANQSLGEFNLVQQSFSEMSFTYGAQLLDLDQHKLRVGFTGKRVFGARIGYLNASADRFSIRPETGNPESSELVLSNFQYESGYSQATQKMKIGNLLDSEKYGSGWGYDLGITYELGAFWKNREEKFDENPQYLIRLGASLTDVGSIRYKTSGSKVISGQQDQYVLGQQNLEVISDQGPEGFMSLLPAQSDTIFSKTVRLPQAFHLEADIQLVKGFFLNLSKTSRFNPGKAEIPDVYQPNSFTITPRFEDEDSDFAFPISFVEGNKRPSIGAVGHFGPVFLGFSNINGLIKKTQPKGSMVYVGVTAWKLRREKSKK